MRVGHGISIHTLSVKHVSPCFRLVAPKPWRLLTSVIHAIIIREPASYEGTSPLWEPRKLSKFGTLSLWHHVGWNLMIQSQVFWLEADGSCLRLVHLPRHVLHMAFQPFHIVLGLGCRHGTGWWMTVGHCSSFTVGIWVYEYVTHTHTHACT